MAVMSIIEEKMQTMAALVENKLSTLLANSDNDIKKLYDAMSYSLLGGGKRVRPFLVLAVSDMLFGDRDEALTYAAALEMIHTYSLIHDDLPCMDNDDLRRGRPTCHKVYGDARAVLAGDALLTFAFEIVSTDTSISAEHRIKAVEFLSRAAGPSGMIAGQEMDVSLEGEKIEYETMIKIHNLKTVELIKCACRLGALAADAVDDQTIADLDTYAEGVGRVFQLVDDIMDACSTAEEIGKSAGSDEKNHKTTYLSFMPVDLARQLADVMTEKAVDAISHYQKRDLLCDFADYLKNRKF